MNDPAAVLWIQHKVGLAEGTEKIRQALKDKGTEVVENIREKSQPLTQGSGLLVATADLKDAVRTRRVENPKS